jgi:hypothetical protein
MMAKIKIDVKIKDLDGKVIKMPAEPEVKEADREEMTLGRVSRQSLLIFDEKHTGDEKYEAYTTARKIDEATNGVVELKSEEITKIKAAIGKYFSAQIIGPVWDLLEASVPKDSSK